MELLDVFLISGLGTIGLGNDFCSALSFVISLNGTGVVLGMYPFSPAAIIDAPRGAELRRTAASGTAGTFLVFCSVPE